MDWLLDFLLGAAQRQQELQQQLQIAQAQADATAFAVVTQLQPLFAMLFAQQQAFFRASVKITLIVGGSLYFLICVAWWDVSRKLRRIEAALSARPVVVEESAAQSVLGL